MSKVKINIWAIAMDTDYGLFALACPSQEEAQQSVIDFINKYHLDSGMEPFTDYETAMEYFQELPGNMDATTIEHNTVEVEIPEITQLRADKARLNDFVKEALNYLTPRQREACLLKSGSARSLTEMEEPK